MDLTPTAIIVLGLLELGEATPYELKVRVAASVGNFWSVPHSALYAEPERLAKAGLAEERRERGGRRRRVFSITDAGRRALAEWRAEPTSDPAELRDPALLKLFFGADPARMAAAQLPLHRERLARYEDISALDDGSGPRGPFLALEAGIRHEHEWIAFWEELA
jgi:DNA-binding PadR family transcriptional regulator